MRLRSLGKRIAGCALILALIVLSASFFLPTGALADDEGVAMSGNFAGHQYEIPAGSSASSSEIFVTVSSEYTYDIDINMSAIAPVGVSVNLSPNQFSLKPGLENQQKISITIIVTKDAAAGNYTLAIKATPHIKNPGDVQIMPEIMQAAKLSVTGDSAHVSVMAVSPEGKQVTAVVRLFKLINERLSEVCYNDSGYLETVVAPGNFTAQAYVGGKLLDEETFDVAANENKDITLQAGTIFFENPGVIAYTNNETGKLEYAHIYYTLRNVYQKVDKVDVYLGVSFKGNQISERGPFSFESFDTGRASGFFDYTPTSGNGLYGFTLKLYVNNISYGNSPEIPFEVTDGQAAGGGGSTKENSNLPLIIGVVCAAAILVAIAYYMVHKSRKIRNAKNKK
jgi:hypothetical protein